jgi:hypothetical protein
MEQETFTITLTAQQAQFVFNVLTNTALPFREVAPVIDAFQRANQEQAAKPPAEKQSEA